MGLDNIEGVKEGCEGDVQSEILAGGEWTRCCSPPLTPGMLSTKDDPSDWKKSYVKITAAEHRRWKMFRVFSG